MHAELLVLRLVHVVSAVLWVGAMVFMAGFLMPAMQQAGPAGGAVMGALVQRRAMTYMPVVALLTLLSGFRLYWIMAAGSPGVYSASRAGMTFLSAGLLATVAFALGMAVTRPAMARVGAIAQQLAGATDAERPMLQAEMQRLRARGRTASTVVAALVLLAAAGMAVARYL